MPDATGHEAARTSIADEEFIGQLKYLRRLKRFVIQEGIEIDEARRSALNIRELASLKYDSKGRAPTDQEWAAVDEKTIALAYCLNEVHRKKFRLSQAAEFLFAAPYFLIAFAAFVLVFPIAVGINLEPRADGQYDMWAIKDTPLFIFFVLWMIVLGALGSMAFVLVNALGIHVDPLVDAANRQLTVLRILLGALFALILTLPFGYPAFQGFYLDIRRGGTEDANLENALFLLMPFLLGFSTSLVLSILNRLVESAQAFFGVSPKSDRVDER